MKASSEALAAFPVCRESESMGLVRRVAVSIRFLPTIFKESARSVSPLCLQVLVTLTLTLLMWRIW